MEQTRDAPKTIYFVLVLALFCAYKLFQYEHQRKTPEDIKRAEIEREKEYAEVEREKAIVHDLMPLIDVEAMFPKLPPEEYSSFTTFMPDWGQTQRKAALRRRFEKFDVRGRVLLWNIAYDRPHLAQAELPTALRAKSSDVPFTVFLIKTTEKSVGSYPGTSCLAVQTFFDIVVAYWPEKKPIGVALVAGPPPPSSVSFCGSDHRAHGSERPEKALAEYIIALPREE